MADLQHAVTYITRKRGNCECIVT